MKTSGERSFHANKLLCRNKAMWKREVFVVKCIGQNPRRHCADNNYCGKD